MTPLEHSLHSYGSPERAHGSQRFFKTGPGQYGEGDIFIGTRVPECRLVAKQFKDLSLGELQTHLASGIHEVRLTALLILVEKYKAKTERETIVRFYLDNLRYVNNWDLVDLSADKILGSYLADKEKSILYKLAQSKNLWERRVAIVATLYFIRKGMFEPTLKIAELLMNDNHDLIHKACGWMLREIGKKNNKYLETFLQMHYKKMPRTMLRYSIERFPPERRKKYLEGTL